VHPGCSGTVTKTSGRYRMLEIDGQKASDVVLKWSATEGEPSEARKEQEPPRKEKQRVFR
jgi:hypothetical protein